MFFSRNVSTTVPSSAVRFASNRMRFDKQEKYFSSLSLFFFQSAEKSARREERLNFNDFGMIHFHRNLLRFLFIEATRVNN